jgi:hypothetical protein
VLINPSKKEGLRVDKLTMVFNCPGYYGVGTTVDPNVPDGISIMFVFDFIIFLFLFLWDIFFFIFI